MRIETNAAKEQAQREEERQLAEQRREAFSDMTDEELDEYLATGLRNRGWIVRRR